jgi:hypothetical protein
MGCLPGHAPIEIFRSQAKYVQDTWNQVTRDMGSVWTIWTEHTLGARQCLSDRPTIRAPHVAAVTEKLRLHIKDDPHS